MFHFLFQLVLNVGDMLWLLATHVNTIANSALLTFYFIKILT